MTSCLRFFLTLRLPTPPPCSKQEAQLELPEGWKRTESRSRPGTMVYENTITGERQAWFPDAPAVDPNMSEEEKKKKVRLGVGSEEAASLFGRPRRLSTQRG